MAQSALIVDDEADVRELIAMSLDRIGIDTHTAANLAEARNLLDIYKFDVCLTDMKLPDGNGVDFVSYAIAVQPDLPVAVITAHGDMDAAVDAMKNGAFDFVSKPVDINELRKLVSQAVKNRKLDSNRSTTAKRLTYRKEQSENTDNQMSSDTELIGKDKLIGRSEPLRALSKLIVKVARTNAPVWITGESGTGKELIARLIHENGPRSSSPFVAINCGAIPSELMESEMFGHRKGSFTGAHSDHDGLFKRAEGGTLFLDEVAELPLHMQVKLLRAIQERKIRPVGVTQELDTDVRILSASHKDLADEVDSGRFRHDLYYRLNVICIKAPSLRERSTDIALIARHVLSSIAHKEGKQTKAELTPDAEALLSNYPFPGNVRELENILERAVALSDSLLIEVDDLNLQVFENSNLSGAGNTINPSKAANDSGERQLILNALAKTRWNRKAAAEQLGMTYRQLRYRIKQYGIDDDQGITGS
jgi:two-component system response regulator PilR (NtrC family)